MRDLGPVPPDDGFDGDEWVPDSERETVMQVRCVNCKREQYALAVSLISEGRHPCVWCGVTPEVFTDERQYRLALARPRPPAVE